MGGKGCCQVGERFARRVEDHQAKMDRKKRERALRRPSNPVSLDHVQFEADHKLQARLRAKLKELRARKAAGEIVDVDKEAEEFEV